MQQHHHDRLYALDYAVQQRPHAPVNYLLRGEYWLEVGDVQKAAQDFSTVRRLASQGLHASDWGYIYQSYIDRADEFLQGLG
jgi:hypothetical protein